ncbi:signal peptidase II [Magnetospirillum sp. SS-4]|uniref:signal peptidase II n=1 Tax=Magnetospirillum sp. SS-4 TaxID=2681465 RepID=UPI00137FFD58|nr:signal peptidase II [Magnetospirillum sp. SS-4]CAA7612489.1 Lipoprotein signal peptidase [Magnetospirillum sp. SS-4]
MNASLRLGLAVALVIAILDQITKWWMIEMVMRPDGIAATPFFSPVRIAVTPFFNLVMTWNRGVSFGIGNNGGDWNALILSGLALAIVAAMLVWLRNADTLILRLALGGIIGGALGNVVDRLRFGAVADFLDFHLAGYHFPAFNLADSAITVGAVILVFDSLFTKRDSTKN